MYRSGLASRERQQTHAIQQLGLRQGQQVGRPQRESRQMQQRRQLDGGLQIQQHVEAIERKEITKKKYTHKPNLKSNIRCS